MIYLVIAVIFLHIITLPITVKICAKADTDNGTAKITVKLFFIPIYSKIIALEKIKKKIFGSNGDVDPEEQEEEKEEQADSQAKTGAFKKFLSECAVAVGKRIRVRDMDLAALIGTGDAAADAVTVGALRIAYKQACCYFGISSDGDIRPEYNDTVFFFDFFGIFSLCFADIIFAVCGALLSTIRISKRRNYANVAE